MLRRHFERELQDLQDRLLNLGSQVEENISEAVRVLRARDAAGSQRLIAGDKEINAQRIAIMTDALVLIATQQPMAGDMRLIASIIEITGELERINDYVKGIARITFLLGPEPVPDVLGDLPLMAEKTRYMLHRALDAVSQRNAKLAQAIPAGDSEVDVLFNRIYRNLVTYVSENPTSMSIELANHLEWAAHNLERAADRVTNICEWVVYQVTGKYVEMDSEIEGPPPQVLIGFGDE
jgi:phosphate transport system protein